MPSPRAKRVASGYGELTGRIREAVVGRVVETFAQTIVPEQIAETAGAFVEEILPLLEAGQLSMQSAAAALVDAVGSVSTDIDLRIPGTTRDGKSLADGAGAWGPMMLEHIAGGHSVQDALEFGRYLVERFTDNELTGAADRELTHQAAEVGELIGWEGVVAPDACDECQANAGVHPLDWVAYRHGNCGCQVVPVFGAPGEQPLPSEELEAVPGQSQADIAAVADKWSPEATAEGIRVRTLGVGDEPGVSETLLGVSDGHTMSYADAMQLAPPPPGGDLAGYENRLKSLESLTRKITTDARARGIGLEESADAIGDVIRYTLRVDVDEYVDQVARAASDLQAAGYTPTKWKPSWDDPVYRGVNSNWRTPDGTVFELQFHTPESFYTKELNHHDYEQQRILDRNEQMEEWERLDRSMSERTAALEQPSGWESLKGMVTVP